MIVFTWRTCSSLSTLTNIFIAVLMHSLISSILEIHFYHCSFQTHVLFPLLKVLILFHLWTLSYCGSFSWVVGLQFSLSAHLQWGCFFCGTPLTPGLWKFPYSNNFTFASAKKVGLQWSWTVILFLHLEFPHQAGSTHLDAHLCVHRSGISVFHGWLSSLPFPKQQIFYRILEYISFY